MVKAGLSKGVSIPFISFFILITVVSVPVFTATALLPRFTNHLISAKTPYVNQSPRVTVFISFTDEHGNDISGLIGSITLYLFWSRDESNWYSITMSVSGTETYYSDIPAQDGSDNWLYDDGAGPCYWYVKIENNKDEENFYYSPEWPNGEIYFFSTEGETTTVVSPEENVTDNIPPLVEIPLAIITELFDPAGNPFVKGVVILITAVIVFIWATKGKGFVFLRGLFGKG